jgi:hypothetical protein
VPVELTVADYRLPAPRDLDLWISLMQSPAQLAFAYQVAPYGEEHWRAIEASTRLLGAIGHHVLFVPVLWHANCGSGPQMVVFRRQGDTLVPDFSRLERWFGLIGRECGPQRLLVLGVWGRWLRPEHPLAGSLHLTELTADGRLTPLAWSSDYAAHAALWTAVHRGVADLAARHLGLAEDRIVLGFADDAHPTAEQDAAWRTIAPRSMGWDAWTHDYAADRGPRPAFFQIVDTAAPASVDALLAWPLRCAPLVEPDRPPRPFYVSSCRDVQDGSSPAVIYYSVPDLVATAQKMGDCIGFSRLGLDFWPKTIPLVDGTTAKGDGFAQDARRKGREHPGKVMRNYRGILTARGPTGALPLIHFAALREGVQAAQARLTIAQGAATVPARAAGWRAVLERQFTHGMRHAIIRTGNAADIAAVTVEDLYAGWAPLFTAAGEAQRALAAP